jgi:hypothetical protein
MASKLKYSFLLLIFCLPGCPQTGITTLFTEPMIVRISFIKDGICNCPLYVRMEQKYINANNYQYFQDIYIACNSRNNIIVHNIANPDTILLEHLYCGITISHASSQEKVEYIANSYQIYDWDPDQIDLSLHAINLCTNEEFHYEGMVDTFDISIFEDCRKMLDGWAPGEKKYTDECYSHIPITITAAYTPATTFDWTQYPKYIEYRDRTDCEDTL